MKKSLGERLLPGFHHLRHAMPSLSIQAGLALGLALFLTGCASQKTDPTQNAPTTQVTIINLRAVDLQAGGIAFITPSSVTGQEEDRQALALGFTEVLRQTRPDLRVVSLPQTLSEINHQGLTQAYTQMYKDYHSAGIFDRETLQKVGKATGARYLAQLKLAAFRQESRDRWGLLGVRMMETKSSTIRLFLQIWDTQDGSVVWEGAQESRVSQDSMAEEYISMKRIVEESARHLVAHIP
jgi:hypothetical protein